MTLLAESTQQKQIGLFTREVLPSLKDFPIDTVTRALVSAITLKLQESGREGTAQDVWKSVSAFLTWCVQQGFIETLVDLMRNAKEDRVRGTAAQALLDRGWGKPKVEVATREKPEGYLAALQAVSERVKARGK